MMFDMKQARDSNTVSDYRESIWRVFVDGKLFISDDNKTTFDSEEEARRSFYDSHMWRKISEYVCYSQVFFGKAGDAGWREGFENKIIHNLNVKIKEYNCHDEGTDL